MPSCFNRTLLLASASSMLLLAGCASDTPNTDASVAPMKGERAIKPIDNDAYARLGYRLEWTGFATVTAGARLQSLDVLGDVLGAQDSGGVFSMISPLSGETKWNIQVSTPVTKFVGAVREDKRIIVCSSSEAFFVDVDTGTMLNRQRFTRSATTKPVLHGPLLVFGTASGEIEGHYTSTGVRAWLNGVGGSFDTNPAMLAENLLGFTSSTGNVVILDPNDGTSTTRAKLAGGIFADACADGQTMYVASADQSIYAFDAYSSSPKWRRRTDSVLREAPAVYGNSVFVTVPSAGMVCLDAATGTPRWTTKGVSGSVINVNKGSLIVWNGKEMVRMTPDTGDVLERAIFNDVSMIVADRFVDGNLYVCSGDGTINKFRQR